MTYRSLKSVKQPEQWQTGSSPGHPCRRIEVGGLWVLVLSFKFDQNRLSGYQDFRGQNLGPCITWANSLYNAVQAWLSISVNCL